MADYSIGTKKRGHKKLYLFLSCIVLVGLIGFSSAMWLRNRSSPQGATPPEAAKVQNVNQASSVLGHYLFHGTTVWARAVERDSRRADGTYDYAHPFSQLDTFDRKSYDAWITSFECPVTNNIVPFAVQVSQLTFNCRPEFLSEAKKYFDVYDLANNHTGDQGGAVGLAETRQHLAEAGVQYFGSFDPGVAKDICEVITLPVRIQKQSGAESKANLPVAMCGWHYFFRKPLASEIEQMKQYAKVMPVLAFVEMGTEYQPTANAIQQEIAHVIADQGPEFVIANNPHWVQNTEVYNGRLIVYATGNFIFDQLEPEEQRSASIDVTMSVKYDKNVQGWLDIASKCKQYQDDCLSLANRNGLTKISLTKKYAVVAGQGGAGKLTHRADTATQSAVEQRMNWADTLSKLGQK